MDIVDREGQPIEEPDKGGFLVIRRPFPHFSRTVWGDPERFAETWNQVPACTPRATWPCATPTGTTWWWAAPTTCSTLPATASARPRWSRRWCPTPEVAEAAVIGKPDELRGEVIKGFVTLRMGSEGSDRMINELQLHVRRSWGR